MQGEDHLCFALSPTRFLLLATTDDNTPESIAMSSLESILLQTVRPQSLAFAPQKTSSLVKTKINAIVLGFYSLSDSQETLSLLLTLKKQSSQSSNKIPLAQVGYVQPGVVANQLGIHLAPSVSWILGNQGWIQVSFASSLSQNDNHHQVNHWSCQHVLQLLSSFGPIKTIQQKSLSPAGPTPYSWLVEFMDVRDARDAVQSLHGRSLKVTYYTPTECRAQGTQSSPFFDDQQQTDDVNLLSLQGSHHREVSSFGPGSSSSLLAHPNYPVPESPPARLQRRGSTPSHVGRPQALSLGSTSLTPTKEYQSSALFPSLDRQKSRLGSGQHRHQQGPVNPPGILHRSASTTGHPSTSAYPNCSNQWASSEIGQQNSKDQDMEIHVVSALTHLGLHPSPKASSEGMDHRPYTGTGLKFAPGAERRIVGSPSLQSHQSLLPTPIASPQLSQGSPHLGTFSPSSHSLLDFPGSSLTRKDSFSSFLLDSPLLQGGSSLESPLKEVSQMSHSKALQMGSGQHSPSLSPFLSPTLFMSSTSSDTFVSSPLSLFENDASATSPNTLQGSPLMNKGLKSMDSSQMNDNVMMISNVPPSKTESARYESFTSSPGSKLAVSSNGVDYTAIASGKDSRSTFMIRNIPNKYTQQMLIDFLNETHKGLFDFLYLRMDFKNKCNVGYAFINFPDSKSVLSLADRILGKKWTRFNSDKIATLCYANVQGLEALVEKFRNSSVMLEEPAFRPKIFDANGNEVAFPCPSTRVRPKVDVLFSRTD